MKSKSWFHKAFAVSAALLVVIVAQQPLRGGTVYVDPDIVGTVTDNMSLGNNPGFDGTYRIGDVNEAGEDESRIWVKFLLPNPTLLGNTIDSATLILDSFNHAPSGSGSPGLSVAPATNAVNASADSWDNTTISNTHVVDATLSKPGFADDVAVSSTVEIDVTDWFDVTTLEGLGQYLTVRLMGGAGYSAFTNDGWMAFGAGPNGTAPAINPSLPAMRLELVLSAPEPSAGLMSVFGMLALLVVRRRFGN